MAAEPHLAPAVPVPGRAARTLRAVWPLVLGGVLLAVLGAMLFVGGSEAANTSGWNVLALLALGLATGLALALQVKAHALGRERRVREALSASEARWRQEHQRTADMLAHVARGVSAHTGETFFRELVAWLAQAVPGVDRVHVAEVVDGHLRLLAEHPAGSGSGYALEGTPCARVAAGETVRIDVGLAALFPDVPAMAGLQGYLGHPLWDAEGRVRGVLVAYSRHRLTEPEIALSTLEIFAARAAAELERTQAEAAVRQERTMLQQVIDGINEDIVLVGADRRVRLMNRTARERAPDARSCRDVAGAKGPCPPAGEVCPIDLAVTTGQPATVVHKQQEDRALPPRWVEVDAAPLRDATGAITSVIVSRRDITERKRAEEELLARSRALEAIAHHDALTSLPNRTLFFDRLRQALHKARRRGSMVAVLFLDLDRFKPINDTHGHEVGDVLLQVVARRLQQCVREMDTVARHGGDEFMLVLEDLVDAGRAGEVARRVCEALQVPVEVGPHRLQVEASVGVAVFPTDGSDAEALVRAADAAMYGAKQAGRNTWRFFTPELDVHAEARGLLAEGLRLAVHRRQLRVVYQPQIELGSGRVVGVEALLRWDHPELGAISPERFLPVAEATGEIVPIGDWALRAAIAQHRRWQGDGIAPPLLAVNLSGRQFQREELEASLVRALEEGGMTPPQLELEITENLLLQDTAVADARLRDLTSLGMHIALDDFGTGYSSLRWLRRFPIERLKIDRTFVHGIGQDPHDTAVTRAIIGLANTLDFAVVAEGVEREDQAAFLVHEGVQVAQGYLVGRPMTGEETTTFLRLRSA